MPYDPDCHHRRSVRLPEYDYTRPGAYFVTICTHQRECLFGDVVDDVVHLSAWGDIAAQCWRDIPAHLDHVELDEWVVMPNHVHGILLFHPLVGATHASAGTRVGAQHTAPLQKPNVAPGSLGAVIRSFKSAVTRRINEIRSTPGTPLWQRNYYEHVIRTERALNAIRQYIADNPARWLLDRYHPHPTGRDPRAAELWRLLQEEGPQHAVLPRRPNHAES
jgi:putative transposase